MVARYITTKKKLQMTFQDLAFLAFLAGLILLFFARDVLGIGIPLLAFVALFVAGYLVFDYDRMLALSAMLPLLNHGIQTNYIVMGAIAVYLLKYSRELRFTPILVTVLCMMIIEFLHCIIPPFSYAEYLRYFVQYMYVALILSDNNMAGKLKNPLVVIHAFIAMATYYMLDIFLVTLKFIPFSELMSSNFRFGTLEELIGKRASLYDNENMIGLFALIAILLLVVSIYRTRKKIIFKTGLILYFVYFGLLTVSKTFVLCLILSALFVVLYINRKNIFKAITWTGIMCVVAGMFAYWVFPEALERVFERFTYDDLSTGRVDLIKEYNEYIFSDWRYILSGIGMQGMVQKTGIFNVTHNAIQEILVCWGIIGMILMVVFGIQYIRCAQRILEKRVSLMFYMPLLIYCVFLQTLQFIRLVSLWNLLLVLFITILSGKDEPLYEGKVFHYYGRYRRG